MATAQLYNLDEHRNKQPNMRLVSRTTSQVWLDPDSTICIAPDVHIGIEYDCIDDRYIPRYKLWIGNKRIKDAHLDRNNQIDLSISIRRVITLIGHERNPLTGRINRTHLEIKEVTPSWEL